MKVYLVQHALAFSKEEDPARNLTPEGRETMEKIGEFAQNYADISIKKIYHSEKARARQTAEILGKYLHPSEGIHLDKDLLPNSDPAIWHAILAETNDQVLLVGHFPHLQRLYELLIPQTGDKDDPDNISRIQIKNGAIYAIERVDEGKWVVDFEILPENAI